MAQQIKKGKKVKLRPEISAGALVFKRTPQGLRFLLIKDSYGKWTFPKGHVEKDETTEQAALRETAEEAGISASKITPLFKLKKPVKILFTHPKTKKLTFKIMYFFVAEYKDGEEPKPSPEIQEVKWFSFDEALESVGYKNTREYLKEAKTKLD